MKDESTEKYGSTMHIIWKLEFPGSIFAKMAKFMGEFQRYSSRPSARLRKYIKIEKTHGDGQRKRQPKQQQ